MLGIYTSSKLFVIVSTYILVVATTAAAQSLLMNRIWGLGSFFFSLMIISCWFTIKWTFGLIGQIKIVAFLQNIEWIIITPLILLCGILLLWKVYSDGNNYKKMAISNGVFLILSVISLVFLVSRIINNYNLI